MSKPTPQEALVYLMVIVSASDRDMGDQELARIGAIIHTLPVFEGFQQSQTLKVAQDCQQLLNSEIGLDGVLARVRESLSEELRETAYALCVDVAAADHSMEMEEFRILDIVREKLGIAAEAIDAIDLAASIRHRVG